jgi:hypothetical protein
MDTVEFERENVELVGGGRVDEAERRLLDRCEHAKNGKDAELLV